MYIRLEPTFYIYHFTNDNLIVSITMTVNKGGGYKIYPLVQNITYIVALLQTSSGFHTVQTRAFL